VILRGRRSRTTLASMRGFAVFDYSRARGRSIACVCEPIMKPYSLLVGFRSIANHSSSLKISHLHAIRDVPLGQHTEEAVFNLYLRSQEDPWMKDKLADYCSAHKELKHITTEYLDRIAKLKLFL
jgi:hypothetical protein